MCSHKAPAYMKYKDLTKIQKGGTSWLIVDSGLMEQTETYTTDPENSPAAQRSKTICHMFWLNPKRDTVKTIPQREVTKTGFRPYLSAMRPHGIMVSI